jgi:hypothetical protein
MLYGANTQMQSDGHRQSDCVQVVLASVLFAVVLFVMVLFAVVLFVMVLFAVVLFAVVLFVVAVVLLFGDVQPQKATTMPITAIAINIFLNICSPVK